MTKLVLGAAIVAAALATMAGVAKADDTNAVVVDAPTCVFDGGTVSVPAGSTVRFKVAWLAKTRLLARLAELDLRIKMSDAAGNPVAGSWDPQVYQLDDQGWYSIWNTIIGPVDAPVTIQSSGTLLFPLVDGLTFNDDGTPYWFTGQLWNGPCTIVPE